MPVPQQPFVCQLLSEDENQRLIASLGAKCVANCAAVVCVYVPDGPNHWRQIHCGVATIEKDSFLKSYFFRVYDLVKFMRLHEETIFLEMGYTALTPNFHTFQGARFPVGLAFADIEEARTFRSHFENLVSRWSRKLDTVTQHQKMPATNPKQPASERPIACRLLSDEDKRRLRACLDSKCVVECAAVVQPKKSITISAPTNFRHVQHMGFNKDSKRFDMSVLDEGMLQKFLKDNNLHCLFNTAEDTEFAAQFIAKNIGIKKFNQAMKGRAPPPPVPAAAPSHGATPPVPSFPNRPTMPPPPVPTNFPRPHTHAPPPPPPVQSRPPLQGRVPPSTVPAGGPAPAPPPPPPPPPPAPASNDRSDASDAALRPPAAPIDLQAQIHNFNKNTLRRVSDTQQPLAPVLVTGDSHKDLLAATLGEALNNLISSRRAYLSDEDSSEDSDF
nr:unnamed protein product [Spirometra erinaceieuropaei]